MIPENEECLLIRRLGKNDDVQSQIPKWCDAWKENKGDASMVNFENFNQLFLNVMTRMNVLFSRPEKRILVINQSDLVEKYKSSIIRRMMKR